MSYRSCEAVWTCISHLISGDLLRHSCCTSNTLPNVAIPHFLQDMPIIRSQLQRSLGRQLGHHTANFRSCSRPLGACVAPHSRQLHCLASGEASSNGESGSRGQGFGKSSSSQQKKQKLQVSNTADALLRSLGGKLLASAHLESVFAIACRDDGVLWACTCETKHTANSQQFVLLQRFPVALVGTLDQRT